jgi:hypothetical protein
MSGTVSRLQALRDRVQDLEDVVRKVVEMEAIHAEERKHGAGLEWTREAYKRELLKRAAFMVRPS